MKFQHYSIWGIFPAIGFIIAGVLAMLSHEQKTGAFIIGGGIVYILIWFVSGLFKRSD